MYKRFDTPGALTFCQTNSCIWQDFPLKEEEIKGKAELFRSQINSLANDLCRGKGEDFSTAIASFARCCLNILDKAKEMNFESKKTAYGFGWGAVQILKYHMFME